MKIFDLSFIDGKSCAASSSKSPQMTPKKFASCAITFTLATW